MNIKSILLTLILIIGVATTATTEACCPRGCGRFNPFHNNILYSSYYSTINGVIVAVTDQEQVIIKTYIGFIIVPSNIFVDFSNSVIGRKITVLTPILPTRTKRIVVIGIITHRKRRLFNHPVYCNVYAHYRYKRNRWIRHSSNNKRLNRIYWLW